MWLPRGAEVAFTRPLRLHFASTNISGNCIHEMGDYGSEATPKSKQLQAECKGVIEQVGETTYLRIDEDYGWFGYSYSGKDSLG